MPTTAPAPERRGFHLEAARIISRLPEDDVTADRVDVFTYYGDTVGLDSTGIVVELRVRGARKPIIAAYGIREDDELEGLIEGIRDIGRVLGGNVGDVAEQVAVALEELYLAAPCAECGGYALPADGYADPRYCAKHQGI